MKEKNPFEETLSHKLKNAFIAKSFAGASNALFGDFVDRHFGFFEGLRNGLKKANMGVLFRTYVSEMFFASSLAFITAVGVVLMVVLIAHLAFFLSMLLFLTVPVSAFIGTFFFLYKYPSTKCDSRKEDIEANLPFALNQMNAVVSSNVAPSSLFEMLTDFEEYGEISREANKIVKRVKVFGEDITTAMRDVAIETPSEELKDLLYGMLATMETGGDLRVFIKEMSKSALFEYRMKMKKYIQKLSMYASIYTALLVAAPLFMVVIVALLSMFGGNFLGININDLLWFGILVLIPLMNTGFILLLVITHKKL